MPRDLKAPIFAEPFFTRRERLDAYQHLTVRPFQKGEVVASWVRREQPGLGLTLPNARSAVCVATVNLRDLKGDDAWCDERHLRRGQNSAGALEILDHRHVWRTNITEPLEIVQVFMPLRALNELMDELRASPIETLVCTVEAPQLDPVMHGLALALLPAFANPAEASALFVDHVFAAMRMHLAQRYGGLRPPAEIAHGGLTPWQERRARDLLLDDLRADRSLAELAAACGISARHFSRAFKTTTGLPPHRWLLRQRIERAKELLEGTDDSLSAIALICGFADQSHMTRVFQALAGSGPGAWRRQRRS